MIADDPTLFVHSEPTSNVGHIKNALQSVAVVCDLILIDDLIR